ncbi:MAG: hypothetical protein ACOY5B_07365 [Spirochaetota bacterium]
MAEQGEIMKEKKKQLTIDQKVQQKLLKLRTGNKGIVVSVEVMGKLEQALEDFQLMEKQLNEAKAQYKEAKTELERQDKQLRVTFKDTKKFIKTEKKKQKKAKSQKEAG